MPVIKELVLEKGWKESVNNRFGYCVVIRFIDKDTGKILFKEALKLEDKDFFALAFDKIIKIDEMHKEYINKILNLGIKFSSEVKSDCEKVFGGEQK